MSLNRIEALRLKSDLRQLVLATTPSTWIRALVIMGRPQDYMLVRSGERANTATRTRAAEYFTDLRRTMNAFPAQLGSRNTISMKLNFNAPGFPYICILRASQLLAFAIDRADRDVPRSA